MRRWMLIIVLGLSLTHCAVETVVTQQKVAEQRQKDIEEAKKTQAELEKKLQEAQQKADDQARQIKEADEDN